MTTWASLSGHPFLKRLILPLSVAANCLWLFIWGLGSSPHAHWQVKGCCHRSRSGGREQEGIGMPGQRASRFHATNRKWMEREQRQNEASEMPPMYQQPLRLPLCASGELRNRPRPAQTPPPQPPHLRSAFPLPTAKRCCFPLHWAAARRSIPRTLHQASFPGRDAIYREAGSRPFSRRKWVALPQSIKLAFSCHWQLGRVVRKERKKSMGRKLPSPDHSWAISWLAGKKEESCVLAGTGMKKTKARPSAQLTCTHAPARRGHTCRALRLSIKYFTFAPLIALFDSYSLTR